MNNNYLKNKLPKNTASINLPKLNIRFNLKQLKTIFKVMAYYNLNQLYQNGIAKEYYVKKMDDEEKKNYIEKYINYYKEKYYQKKDYLKLPPELSEVEQLLSFEDIQEMRDIAYKKLDYLNDYFKKEQELKKEEEKWYGRDNQKIEELKKDLKKLEKIKQKLENKQKRKAVNFKESIMESYKVLNERFNDENSSMFFSINEIRFIIYENVKKNIKDKLWEYKNILIKLVASNFDVEGMLFQSRLKFSISLNNAIITQEKTKNKNYEKLFFGDLDNRGKVLYLEFEKNPKFEKSDYKFIMRSEKKIHLLYDLHIFNYIMEKIMNILNTKINFEEIQEYAKQDSINEYIKSGYVDSFLENFQHFNIDLHIELSYPIILLPLDSFNPDNNKCLYLRLGKLEILSDLPPRQEKSINYKEIEEEKLMYDIYNIKLIGTKLSTLTDCTPVNNCIDCEEYETKIVRDFNLTIVFKKLIEIKNPFFDDIVCELRISKVEMKLDEFQILFIIDYLGNFFKNTKSLFEENEIDKFLGIGQEEKDEEKIIQDFQDNYNKKLRNSTNFRPTQKIDEESSSLDSEDTKNLKTDTNNNEISIEKEQINIDKKIETQEKDKTKTDKKLDNKSIYSDNNSVSNIEGDKKTIDNENEDNEIEKKDSFKRINEIKNSKKRTMRIKFVMNEMSLNIKKIHFDLKGENFLILEQKAFEVDYYMMNNNDMLTILRMKNISLYDKDIDEKKNNVVLEQFQCLMNSSQNINNDTINFIDMTSLYRKIDGTTEIDTIFDMNDLNIIISFESLLRIYQFMMYYYDKYNEMVYNIEHPQEKEERKKN